MVVIRGRYLRRRSSVANRSIIQQAMLWIEMKAATVTSPRASSSKMIAESSRPRPEPPTSSGT